MFREWVRAADLFKPAPYVMTYKPQSVAPQPIAAGIHGYDLVASMGENSAVVACLAAAAHYEFKSSPKDHVISGIIYPQDETGSPIYNPSGKYAVKMYFNGTWREVTVDDYFPLGEAGAPLFTYDPTGALWAPILEKAYAKVCGGYGNISNPKPSNVMFAYTSWLPERLSLKTLDRGYLWEHLKGEALLKDRTVILSTGAVKDESEVGLKSFCSYAVLETLESGPHKLFLVKNTRLELKWSGAYSWEDPVNWSKELKAAAGYDSLLQRKDRLFWIDLDSVFEYFDYIDINWRPNLLTRRRNVWDMHPLKDMCDDKFNLLQSPQYSLDFNLTPMDTLPEVVLYAIVTKLHTKDEPLVAGDLPESAMGEDLIGLSAFENDKYGKVVYNDYPLSENDLTTDEIKAYRFTIPRDKLFQKHYINVALRQFIRRRDLYYK